jgi:hypothetical protein
MLKNSISIKFSIFQNFLYNSSSHHPCGFPPTKQGEAEWIMGSINASISVYHQLSRDTIEEE